MLALFCIATMQSSLLALSVQVASMLYLDHFSGLASLRMLFQSIFHAYKLTLITPLMALFGTA